MSKLKTGPRTTTTQAKDLKNFDNDSFWADFGIAFAFLLAVVFVIFYVLKRKK